MSSRQFSEWLAYYKIEPFSNELLDIHLSRLASIQVSTKKKPVGLDKFRLWQKIKKTFSAQEFFNELKEAFSLSKKD